MAFDLDEEELEATRKLHGVGKEKTADEIKVVENITLEEMFEILIDTILNKGEYPIFYYKRENQFVKIKEVDLLDTRFRTEDDDFSEYEWEVEKSNIYILKQQ